MNVLCQPQLSSSAPLNTNHVQTSRPLHAKSPAVQSAVTKFQSYQEPDPRLMRTANYP